MSAGAKRIVILGATSAIAEATARIWAARGARLVLVARNAERAKTIAADLKARGAAQVDAVIADCATADARATMAKIAEMLTAVDVVLLAYGVLGDQTEAERDPAATDELLRTNFTSAAAWCQAAATMLERQSSGTLLVIGSVAGDRGRASNYVYGAAKAGLGILVQGIAHRLARSGARAVLIKPGFVDTPMTAHMPKKGFLWTQPGAVAHTIVKSADRRAPVVYAPSFWRAIMFVVRNVPTSVFHKTQL